MDVECEVKDKPFQQENHWTILALAQISKLISLKHLPLGIVGVLPIKFSPLGYFKLSSMQLVYSVSAEQHT